MTERKCIVSGDRADPDMLVRLALGPDGEVLPDIRAKAPGRGAWIGVTRADLETALAKGKLRGALARAFKTGELQIPDTLPDLIETGLRKALLDRLGLEAKASMVLTGSEKIEVACRKGIVNLLLHAADAAADGNRKLDQALRVGRQAEGTDLAGIVLPVDRSALSMAMGRDNVVHIAVTDSRAASRLRAALGRLESYLGCATGAPVHGERDSANALGA
ncbi:hypothetical protein FHS51_003200 [Sphingobium wenxiniae]|uniref:Transcription terminating nucleic-acid-binding protein n=2 Tax=Sphingobium TaxID=165695 RepID=T0I941_9SPHN|nr:MULTISPECIES: DUF448 domain-containing protein [Sphingobium]EQB06139.1 transcription terminating nucleic-acid-binding protein [Sphingobium baderi LL03]KMS62796.1 transcription terminating nucleic-acid-binding protein [Sphingobium baderi LL03]MBB6192945.1 hypothetical protein [Sphingobium wenxiniae]TWH90454.1 hypothetical protein IQ35_03390 [Sphingobium wenxiniae]WRD76892.1 DUF448 domain-containing protein [Sphingobium baderi]